jgi:hypothetical protein
VEFGPGMTSATQIRTAWPALTQRQRTALVMSLYPNTQSNPKLANTVVKMLDTAMGAEVTEGELDRFKKYVRPIVKTTPKIEKTTNPSGRTTDHVEWKVTGNTGEIRRFKSKKEAQAYFDSCTQGVDEEVTRQMNIGGMTASYQSKYNQPISEDYLDEARS